MSLPYHVDASAFGSVAPVAMTKAERIAEAVQRHPTVALGMFRNIVPVEGTVQHRAEGSRRFCNTTNTRRGKRWRAFCNARRYRFTITRNGVHVNERAPLTDFHHTVLA